METTLTYRQQTDGRTREIEGLYMHAFPAVASLVAKGGGTPEDARDIFQDALMAYYERSGANRDAVADAAGYVCAVARNMWYRQCGMEACTIYPGTDAHEVADIAEMTINEHRLLHLLEATGKRCMELLTAFYYEGMKVGQLAQVFGFRSERSATVQKYKCLEKVRDVVKEKAIGREEFID